MLNAYQKTASLKTAIELDVFTAIGQGTNSAAALAKKCQASERGINLAQQSPNRLGIEVVQEPG